MMITDILNQVGSTSKGSEKVFILTANKDNKILQQVFFYTYSTFHTFGVKKITSDPGFGSLVIDEHWDLVKDLLDSLILRKVTGNLAQDAIESVLKVFDADSQNIIKCIIDRDLKVGATDTIMNRIIPNLVPTFDVALAAKFDESTEKKVTFDEKWFCSRKIDGCRCVAIIHGESATTYSRVGNEFTTLENVKQELIDFVKSMGKDSMVFDGEIGLVDKDGNEDFQGIMKEIKKKDHTIKNPLYQIFDMMTVDEFFEKTVSPVFSVRLKNLTSNFNALAYKTLSVLEQVPLTLESFAMMQKKSDDGKWEGLMIKKDLPYKSGRSKNLLKVKKFHDMEFIVEDIEFGEMNFTEKDIGTQTITCTKALKVLYKGNVVSVGSGLTKQERIDFMNTPEKIIGKTVTVKYFESTTNANGGESLRFPTLKYIHGNKRDT